MGALGLSGEGEVPEQILVDQRARRGDLGRCGFGGDVRHGEARRRDVEQPRVGVIAGRGEQRTVPAEQGR